MKSSQRPVPKVPDGLVDLMKNLAKSVLKEQPENIYLFAAEYFENLLLQRDGSLDKGYSAFRKYEEEWRKKRDLEGCSRCNRLAENNNNNVPADTAVKDDDNKLLDMGVSGVAMKAIPRDSKAGKNQKNKNRLDTIKSESQDSAIEDDGKSISPSPHETNDTHENLGGKTESEEKRKSVEQTENAENGDTVESVEKVEKEDQATAPIKQEENKKTDLMPKVGTFATISAISTVSAVALNAISEENVGDDINKAETNLADQQSAVETNSDGKNSMDEDVLDTPTNETSASDANTDRTVIENYPQSAPHSEDLTVEISSPNKIHDDDALSDAATENDVQTPNTVANDDKVVGAEEKSIADAEQDQPPPDDAPQTIEDGQGEEMESSIQEQQNEEEKSPIEITTQAESADDERKETEIVQTTDLLQTEQENNANERNELKPMERLRTPESDSGLSEKSFNLNIQENEEVAANEINQDIPNAEITVIEETIVEKVVPQVESENIPVEEANANTETESNVESTENAESENIETAEINADAVQSQTIATEKEESVLSESDKNVIEIEEGAKADTENVIGDVLIEDQESIEKKDNEIELLQEENLAALDDQKMRKKRAVDYDETVVEQKADVAVESAEEKSQTEENVQEESTSAKAIKITEETQPEESVANSEMPEPNKNVDLKGSKDETDHAISGTGTAEPIDASNKVSEDGAGENEVGKENILAKVQSNEASNNDENEKDEPNAWESVAEKIADDVEQKDGHQIKVDAKVLDDVEVFSEVKENEENVVVVESEPVEKIDTAAKSENTVQIEITENNQESKDKSKEADGNDVEKDEIASLLSVSESKHSGKDSGVCMNYDEKESISETPETAMAEPNQSSDASGSAGKIDETTNDAETSKLESEIEEKAQTSASAVEEIKDSGGAGALGTSGEIAIETETSKSESDVKAETSTNDAAEELKQSDDLIIEKDIAIESLPEESAEPTNNAVDVEKIDNKVGETTEGVTDTENISTAGSTETKTETNPDLNNNEKTEPPNQSDVANKGAELEEMKPLADDMIDASISEILIKQSDVSTENESEMQAESMDQPTVVQTADTPKDEQNEVLATEEKSENLVPEETNEPTDGITEVKADNNIDVNPDEKLVVEGEIEKTDGVEKDDNKVENDVSDIKAENNADVLENNATKSENVLADLQEFENQQNQTTQIKEEETGKTDITEEPQAIDSGASAEIVEVTSNETPIDVEKGESKAENEQATEPIQPTADSNEVESEPPSGKAGEEEKDENLDQTELKAKVKEETESVKATELVDELTKNEEQNVETDKKEEKPASAAANEVKDEVINAEIKEESANENKVEESLPQNSSEEVSAEVKAENVEDKQVENVEPAEVKVDESEQSKSTSVDDSSNQAAENKDQVEDKQNDDVESTPPVESKVEEMNDLTEQSGANEDETKTEVSESDKVGEVEKSDTDEVIDTPVSTGMESHQQNSNDGQENDSKENLLETDSKSNVEDAGSEVSASNKDDLYERAETEIVGDESVKDFDLSGHDFENNNEEIADNEQHATSPISARVATEAVAAAQEQLDDGNMSIDSINKAVLQPDSLDILADSLDPSMDASLDPSVDSLVDKSLDSLEEKGASAIGDEKEEPSKNDSQETKAENTPTQTKAIEATSSETFQPESLQAESKQNLAKKVERPAPLLLGDLVNDKKDYKNMNEQMQNELAVLQLAERTIPTIAMFGITEVDSPLTPTPKETNVFALGRNEDLTASRTNTNEQKVDEPKSETKTTETAITEKTPASTELNSNDASTNDGEKQTHEKEIIAEHENKGVDLDETKELPTEASVPNETKNTGEAQKFQQVKPAQLLIPALSASNDTPSSDLSDTDTDKPEKIFNESGVDETSRDERDEVSEIENFDLSSCGEDSLEAMYYMIRKNEIIVDKLKKGDVKKCDEEKITFPEKVTDDLDNAFREVSGKNKKICSLGSMNSSADEVILKQLSTDSDGLQVHVIADSEIYSSSEPKTCAAAESTDEECINPDYEKRCPMSEIREAVMCSQSMRDDSKTDDDEDNEIDHFPENHLEDMNQGNIERKILASSLSEPDSDYYELPTNTNRLTKDDFNVSTAFEHMLRTDSTTEDSDSTIESAATKIQATARGFICRRRLRRSSANTSASVEKHSSIGNAAIDKSLDDLAEQQEMLEDNNNNSTESSSELSPDKPTLNTDLTIDNGSFEAANVQGITEVKLEQRKGENAENEITKIVVSENTEENKSSDTKDSDDMGTLQRRLTTDQRRLTLHRGDAMQRNSTPEEAEQQANELKKSNDETDAPKEPQTKESPRSNTEKKEPTVEHKPNTNASRILDPLRILGPRQRSMPVQIETQLMRVLPKHRRKRIKSATNPSSKSKQRPFLF